MFIVQCTHLEGAGRYLLSFVEQGGKVTLREDATRRCAPHLPNSVTLLKLCLHWLTLPSFSNAVAKIARKYEKRKKVQNCSPLERIEI
jgi:hypothetical protein